MSYQELGDFSEQYRSIDTIDARQIRSGELQSVEIILTGGTKGIIRSEDFETAVGGWKIDAAGNAEFNNVTVRGIIEAGVGSDVDWSYISNVTIDNADITDLAFSKITAATNTASLTIGSAGTLRSSNYSAGSAGFSIEGDGSAEFNDVTVRGSLYGDYSEWVDGTVGIIIDPNAFGSGTTPQIKFDVNSSTSDPTLTAFSSTKGLTITSGNSGSGASSMALAPASINMNVLGAAWISMSGSTITFQKALAMGSNNVTTSGTFSGGTFSGSSLNVGSGTVTCGDINASGEVLSTGGGTAGNNHFQAENAGTGMSNSGGVLKFATSSTFRTQLGSAFWGPQTDNNMSTGASGARWSAVWAANGTIQTSDLREKNVLEDSPVPGLSFINQLDPFKYTWKRGDTDHVHWGVAAQQVQKLIGNEGPLRADNPDMLALNYAELVPALIVAVQELSAKLEAYEAR